MRLCQGLACYSPSDSWALGVRESETWWCDGVGFTVHHAVGEAKVKYVERRHVFCCLLDHPSEKPLTYPIHLP
jgi:hypothetical protein